MKTKKKRPDWRLPQDVVANRIKTQSSLRLEHDLLMWLTEEARGAGLGRCNLIEAVLSDYRQFVEQSRAKRS